MFAWGIAGAYAVAVAAGVSFVIQQSVNANLRAEIGSAWWAGFVSYLGGTVVMLVVALAFREPWVGMIGRTSLTSWTGGLFGAIYIAISIALFQKLGATLLVALIVAGQMIGSLAFDHFGLLGVPLHPASASRLIGVILLVAGVICIRN